MAISLSCGSRFLQRVGQGTSKAAKCAGIISESSEGLKRVGEVAKRCLDFFVLIRPSEPVAELAKSVGSIAVVLSGAQLVVHLRDYISGKNVLSHWSLIISRIFNVCASTLDFVKMLEFFGALKLSVAAEQMGKVPILRAVIPYTPLSIVRDIFQFLSDLFMLIYRTKNASEGWQLLKRAEQKDLRWKVLEKASKEELLAFLNQKPKRSIKYKNIFEMLHQSRGGDLESVRSFIREKRTTLLKVRVRHLKFSFTSDCLAIAFRVARMAVIVAGLVFLTIGSAGIAFPACLLMLGIVAYSFNGAEFVVSRWNLSVGS